MFKFISQIIQDRQMHKQIWYFALPMILSNLSVPLVGMVDTAVVGHLDKAYHMGAVAVGAMIFGIVFWGFGFLRMGTTGITAQIYGQGDRAEIRLALVRAVLVALCISVVLLLLQKQILLVAFYLIDASQEVDSYGRMYFEIRIMSAPATLINYVFLGWFLGMQKAKSALQLMLFVNIVNIVLDYLFVMLLGKGADGVAWASLVAEYLGVCYGMALVFIILKKYPGKWFWSGVFHRQKILELLLINKNIFIRTLCLMFTLAYFTAQGSRMGDLILAANAVLVQFQTFMAYGLDGLAHAAEALIGKAVGRRDKQLFYSTVSITLFWALLLSLVYATGYALIGENIIELLTDIDTVRTTALKYLPWVIALPIVSVWSFVFDGIFIGATRVVEMRNIMLVATFVFFMPSWYFLQNFNNHGLWMAFLIFMFARSCIMVLIFIRIERRGGFIVKQ